MTESMDTHARMPVLFLGHGSPMNALERNPFTQMWARVGASVPRPKAILMVSAHWCTRGVGVTAMEAPPTIHDFGAFPQALFDVRYPAPGSPALAARVGELLAPRTVAQDLRWGLDHGAWSVLVHAFPQADIPVVQLSIDVTQPNAYHHEIGRRLQPLRDEGVLIVGSGNVVHNLPAMDWGDPDGAYDWAQRFQDRVRDAIVADDPAPLIAFDQQGVDAQRSIPSADHYLPLLYVLGARRPDDAVRLETPQLTHGSLSMMSVVIGA
jgi:4,5-DOPA dioxygenase extradiol